MARDDGRRQADLRPFGHTNALGHGNDATWNSDTHKILVPAWDKYGPAGDTTSVQATDIRVINPTNLTIESTITAPRSTTALCYDSTHNRYAGGSARSLWTSSQIATDANGHQSFVEASHGTTTATGTSQGIDCDDTYIYVVTSKSSAAGIAQQGNRIYVLDWNLNLVHTYSFQAGTSSSWEVETMTHRGSTYYLSFNTGTGPLYRIAKFQFGVTYYAGGGTGTAPGRTHVLYGVRTHLAKNTFTRSGYTFAGWTAYRTIDGKVRYQHGTDRSDTKWAIQGQQGSGWVPYLYSDQQIVYQTAVHGGVHLTATWKKN